MTILIRNKIGWTYVKTKYKMETHQLFDSNHWVCNGHLLVLLSYDWANLDCHKMNCMGHTTHAGLLSRKFDASFTTLWFNWLHHGVIVACIIHHNRHNLRNISVWKNVKTAINIPYSRSHKFSMSTIQWLPCSRQSVLPWAHENQSEAPLHEKWAKKSKSWRQLIPYCPLFLT